MEYTIKLNWDEEASVWVATNDEIPIALESNSIDDLIKRVRAAVPELIEMNHLEKAKTLYFFAEKREAIAV